MRFLPSSSICIRRELGCRLSAEGVRRISSVYRVILVIILILHVLCEGFRGIVLMSWSWEAQLAAASKSPTAFSLAHASVLFVVFDESLFYWLSSRHRLVWRYFGTLVRFFLDIRLQILIPHLAAEAASSAYQFLVERRPPLWKTFLHRQALLDGTSNDHILKVRHILPVLILFRLSHAPRKRAFGLHFIWFFAELQHSTTL